MKALVHILILLALISTQPALATEADPSLISAAELKRNIEEVLNVLDKGYVYPKTAETMRQHVSKEVSAGHYQAIDSLEALIKKLQSDLREASKDNHISLHLAKGRVDRKTHILPATKLDLVVEADLISAKAGKNKIGYLRFNKFSGDATTKAGIIAAMKKLASTDSLIIDLRENRGGDPALVAFLSSYFLQNDTHLWSILDRNGNTVFAANSVDQGLKYEGKLCVLTSKKMYSAPEAFAYTLKHLGRADIIGEPTRGGAHLVEMQHVNDEIDIRIPVARAYNPITKSNWEGVGVMPTIETEASQAKSVAIEYLSAY